MIGLSMKVALLVLQQMQYLLSKKPRKPATRPPVSCGPLWPWTTPLPTQGGQPPCGRFRGLPTAAAAGTDALRVDKPAACPPSGCPTFEKLNPRGERERGRGWASSVDNAAR